MGFSFKGICYPDAQSAFDSLKADLILDGSSASTSYAAFWFVNPDNTSVDSAGLVTGFLKKSSLVSTQAALQYQFPACTYTGPTYVQAYFDGMTIGWGVVAAMVSALSILFIKKSFFR